MTPRPSRRKLVRLSADLERAILYGIIKGIISPDVVAPEELSKLGRGVLFAAVALRDGSGPLTESAVALHAVEVLGLPKGDVQGYLKEISRDNAGRSAADVLQQVRDKQVLIDVINEATQQLQKGALDVTLIGSHLERDASGSGGIVSVAEAVKDGLPDPPNGFTVNSLPRLSSVSGGVFGLWAVAGEPGVGKSALAFQLAIDLGRRIPVLYYDFENGFSVLMDHARQIFKGDLERIKDATKQIFIRESIRSLDRDLAAVPAPALVIIDSVQKLPSSVEQRRHGLDRWVHRLESLKKRGYSVLLISEIGRSQYNNDPWIGAFKETGEIEYSADCGMQMLPMQGAETVELHIVKNRHRPFKGLVSFLTRKNSWWFKEMAGFGEERVEID